MQVFRVVTPVDLPHLITIHLSVVWAQCDFQDVGRPDLPDVLAGFLERLTPGR